MSACGNLLLVHEGFTYHKEKETLTTSCWKCTEYDAFNCRGRVKVEGGRIDEVHEVHNHVPNSARIQARKVLNNMKQRACETQEGTQQVLASTALQVGAPVWRKMPSVGSLKKMIRRQSNQHHQAPPFPRQYTTTANGQPFLQFDTGLVDDLILMYFTAGSLKETMTAKLNTFEYHVVV
ncbi:UNVERIFIED_CONTAM: hypothetical protein FKN15_006279 [Acipenser sinensis]